MIRSQLKEFMRRMAPNSVAIIPGAHDTRRSNDTHYRFRQNSDFFYLTGFEEPDALAVIKDQKYTLFVRPRDPEREIWDGRRAGVEGAKSAFGADEAFPISQFEEKLGEILNGATNLYYRIGNGNADLDETIVAQIRRLRALGRRGMRAPEAVIDTGTILHEMRLFKSDEEIENMQRAADISAEAHREAMKQARPG